MRMFHIYQPPLSWILRCQASPGASSFPGSIMGTTGRAICNGSDAIPKEAPKACLICAPSSASSSPGSGAPSTLTTTTSSSSERGRPGRLGLGCSDRIQGNAELYDGNNHLFPPRSCNHNKRANVHINCTSRSKETIKAHELNWSYMKIAWMYYILHVQKWLCYSISYWIVVSNPPSSYLLCTMVHSWTHTSWVCRCSISLESTDRNRRADAGPFNSRNTSRFTHHFLYTHNSLFLYLPDFSPSLTLNMF